MLPRVAGGQRFGDRVVADITTHLLHANGPRPLPIATLLLVVGAHRREDALNHELTDRGARFAETVRTAPIYRLHILATQPPKPGLVRVVDGNGRAIEGELWSLSDAALGSFLAHLPPLMTLGRVVLEDGREVVGFGCEPAALPGTQDISTYGSWPAYLARMN